MPGEEDVSEFIAGFMAGTAVQMVVGIIVSWWVFVRPYQ
jgi:hypothetical protein